MPKTRELDQRAEKFCFIVGTKDYIEFESACFTEFKTVLGLKIGYVVLEKF